MRGRPFPARPHTFPREIAREAWPAWLLALDDGGVLEALDHGVPPCYGSCRWQVDLGEIPMRILCAGHQMRQKHYGERLRSFAWRSDPGGHALKALAAADPHHVVPSLCVAVEQSPGQLTGFALAPEWVLNVWSLADRLYHGRATVTVNPRRPDEPPPPAVLNLLQDLALHPVVAQAVDAALTLDDKDGSLEDFAGLRALADGWLERGRA